MRCRPRSGRYHNYIKDNAAAAATTLTIRHSRFAALPLAKLVASLALHPPVSATGSGGLRASSVSLLARHLLAYGRRLLLSCSLIALDRSCPRSQSVTPDSRTQPCPRGTLIADQRGACAARPKGKYSRGRMALAPIRTREFSLPRGRKTAAPPSSFINLTFASQRSFL